MKLFFNICFTALSLALLFPTGYNISGGKCIWLLNVLDEDRRTIGIEYYDLQNHNVMKVSTCYHFSVFCVISANYKKPFFTMLFETFGESIHMICDSNLRLESYPNTLLNCLLQVNHSERLIQYDLITIKCISLKTCICIHGFLKSNLKPYYQCVDSLDTSYILMMHLFLDSNTIEYDHKSMDKAKTTIPFRLKFLQSKISQQFFRNKDHDMKKAFSYFDPTRIFVSNGLYIFNLDTLRLTLFSSNTADLYKLLPMIAFHLETVTDNMIDVPTGCSENEQIISYTLIATHMEQTIISVNYLRFLPKQQEIVGKENRENNTGTDEWWKERDKQLSHKYQRKFLHNFQELHVWVESYDTEVHLLESFIQLYSRGQLLQALVNNAKAKHFFTGHNIIKYDIPFMLRRLKWHQMHQYVDDHVTFDVQSLGTGSIIIKFHKNAYFIDSLRIFKEHLATDLTLNSLTDDTSNLMSVRIYYILGIMLQHYRDDKIINFLQQLANNVMTINSTSGQISPTIFLHELPRNVRNCLTNGNMNIDQLNIYTFDDFLTQNIMVCKSVLDLWEKFNYPKLFSLITQVYPCNLEKALQANLETRIKIAFDYIAIKYRQILSATNTPIGRRNKFRYLFNSRLNESLLYKTTKNFSIHQKSDYIAQCEIYPNYCNKNQDEGIEIDDSRYRKNVDQFFREIYTQCPIVDRVKYKTTKKEYFRSANIALPGVYKNCIQMDIISQYPNILTGKRIFTDAVDICSAGSLQKLLKIDSTLRDNFSSWINADCIQIYLAEEMQSDDFVSYLKDFSLSNVTSEIVGQLVMNIQDLMQLPSEVPLLIYCSDGTSFLNNFLQHLLKVQKSLKKEIFTLVQVEENLSVVLKRTINSVYEFFENRHIPLTAMITMLSRKILIFASKILPVIILQLLFEHLEIWHWFYSQHQLDKVENLERIDDDMLLNAKNSFNPNRNGLFSSLASTEGRKRFSTTCKLILEYFCITFNTICENSSTNELRITHKVLNETNIELLRLRCLIDGQTNVRLLSETREQLRILLQQKENNYIQELFNDLPSSIRNCVFFSDTNGLQFSNTFQLEGKLIIELLNKEIVKAFELDNILFTGKQHAFVFSLANRKCTIFDLNPLQRVKFLKNQEQHVIHIDDCKVQHVGYQTSALPFFKYLCNFIAIICLLMHQGRTLRIYEFREIICSVFNYLESLPPGEMYVRVKLNRHNIDSGKGRFSEKYKQTDNGILHAVCIVNGSTVLKQSINNIPFTLSNSRNHLEQLILLDDYIWSVKHQQKVGNSDNLQLHYGFFLRNFGEIWYKQYCQATNNVDGEINSGSNLKEVRDTTTIIDQYFDDWLSQSSQSRSVDDLDRFLFNRFIVVNKSS